MPAAGLDIRVGNVPRSWRILRLSKAQSHAQSEDRYCNRKPGRDPHGFHSDAEYAGWAGYSRSTAEESGPSTARLSVCGFSFDDVLDQLLLELFLVVEPVCPAGRDVHGLKQQDFPVPDLNLKAKPVGAEHAARSVKRHRGGDLA